MFGLLTDDVDPARADVADETYYLTDQVDGTRREPLSGAINSVACWGDTAAVRENPDRVAVSADGTRAVPETDGHHWATVCPTDPAHREALLERLESVGAVGDVRLTTLGFPGEAFCHCERCRRRFAESECTDRNDWRAGVITRFVADAADRIDGDLTATLYPDPYPGHLRTRAGLEPAALAPHVDEFLVPLCSIGYETTYWVESLARGFASELADLEAAFAVQVSAPEADADRLTGLTCQLVPHADRIVYGAGPENVDVVRETIRRVRSSNLLETAEKDDTAASA